MTITKCPYLMAVTMASKRSAISIFPCEWQSGIHREKMSGLVHDMQKYIPDVVKQYLIYFF